MKILWKPKAGNSDKELAIRLFPELGEDVVLYEKYNWGQLRDKISSGSLREQLRDLYGRLCEVMHARKTITGKEAREVFRETLEVVEELYENHGL